MAANTERIDTVVVGAGQAGLSVGYHLRMHGVPFVILDANERVGDSWRKRWDSLRLFTPARFDGIAGMPFPDAPHTSPTKDAMGDYLEAYAKHFHLPVRNGVRVQRLARKGGRYLLDAGDTSFEADKVIVAMSNYQCPRIPPFASELNPDIVQFHSSQYRNPSQLREGGVLLVGAGNSGSELAMELARTHTVWMSGRDTGQLPFRIDGFMGRHFLGPIVLRGLFHRVLKITTPFGRRARPNFKSKGGPLIRVKAKDLARAGVERVPRVARVKNGLPVLEDGRVMDVPNVIWCTGYHPGFSWIDLPIFEDGEEEPMHHGGIVETHPGLYFVGLEFLYAASSIMVHGVSRDADRIAKLVAQSTNGRHAAIPDEAKAAV